MRFHVLAVTIFLLAVAAAASLELVPLEIQLPEPPFGGEPLSYYGPNLEEPDYRDYPPFLAPAGTSNIAAGKTVTSSVLPRRGRLEQITDGDKHYRSDSVVEFPEGLQWVQVDLKEEHIISAIVLWHFHANLRVYFSVIVQVANDENFEDGVTTLFNNDFDNASGFGKGEDKNYVESYRGRIIDAGAISGRYIRLYSNGNHKDNFSHYIEVEVYGRPGKVDKPDGENNPESPDGSDYVPIKIELPEPSFM